MTKDDLKLVRPGKENPQEREQQYEAPKGALPESVPGTEEDPVWLKQAELWRQDQRWQAGIRSCRDLVKQFLFSMQSEAIGWV